jgi:guanosine-3',5'-bis(diphosphate) 3'-pyrophosphohydrolase
MSPAKRLLKKYILEICGWDDAEDVLSTAELAHTGQTRRTGEPYIEHPIAVANIINQFYPGERLLCTAALLHDTLEDAVSNGNFNDEQELIDTIKKSYRNPSEGLEVLSIVYALTHEKSIDYTEYIMALASNPGALKIKLADMLHNMSSSPSPRQAKKYKLAFDTLSDHHGGMPESINPAHWKELGDVINATITNDTETTTVAGSVSVPTDIGGPK